MAFEPRKRLESNRHDREFCPEIDSLPSQELLARLPTVHLRGHTGPGEDLMVSIVGSSSLFSHYFKADSNGNFALPAQTLKLIPFNQHYFANARGVVGDGSAITSAFTSNVDFNVAGLKNGIKAATMIRNASGALALIDSGKIDPISGALDQLGLASRRIVATSSAFFGSLPSLVGTTIINAYQTQDLQVIPRSTLTPVPARSMSKSAAKPLDNSSLKSPTLYQNTLITIESY